MEGLAKKPPILWVVEDDPGLQFFYKETFAGTFEVFASSSLAQLKAMLVDMTPLTAKPQLIIGDIGLPDGSFLDFLTSAEGSRLNHVPVLIVSAIDDARILRLAFKRGATDYIVKPFSSGEILVKAERFIARVHGDSTQSSAPGLPVDGAATPGSGRADLTASGEAERAAVASALRVDAVTHSVFFEGKVSQLTLREFQIVNALLHSLPLGLRKERLMAAVWHNVNVSAKNLEVQLFRLRKKLQCVDHTVVYSTPYYFIQRLKSASEMKAGEAPAEAKTLLNMAPPLIEKDGSAAMEIEHAPKEEGGGSEKKAKAG